MEKRNKHIIKSYSDLLKEEERLKEEVELSRVNLEKHLQENYTLKGIANNAKQLLPFSGLFTRSKGLVDKKAITDTFENNNQRDALIDLSVDLAYEAISFALIHKLPIAPKRTIKSKASYSIKFIIKAMLDKYYVENKELVASKINQLLNKTTSRRNKEEEE